MTLHVLHAIDSLEEDAGSPAISLRGLLLTLEQLGLGSKVVTRNAGGFGLAEESLIPFEPLAIREAVGGADIVHVHGWCGPLARSVAAEARSQGKPYVVSPLGEAKQAPTQRVPWRERLRRRFTDPRLLRDAAAVTALNDCEYKELQAGRLHGTLTVVPYGFSFHEAQAIPGVTGSIPPIPGHFVLLLGTIDPSSGCVPLLKSLAELGAAGDGWSVVLAGPIDSEDRKTLEAAIRRKGAAERVRIVPSPDPAMQQALLGAASLLVGPSLRLHLAVSVMQAMAAGKPVIASVLVAPPGTQDAIRVCNPTRDGLKTAFLEMFGLTDDERFAQGRKLREIGRYLFDWSVCAPKFIQLYLTASRGL